MKLIIGLGNPGTFYQKTRHNIGSRVVKTLSKKYGASFKRGLFSSSLSARVHIGGQDVILAIPLGYMNVSGRAVAALAKKHAATTDTMLVVFDDLDLELGTLKLRPGGGSGGHNGLQSIIDCLGTEKFHRLRIGIDRPKTQDPEVVAQYVLSSFSRKQEMLLDTVIENACDAIEQWTQVGIEKTMNRINNKHSEGKDE